MNNLNLYVKLDDNSSVSIITDELSSYAGGVLKHVISERGLKIADSESASVIIKMISNQTDDESYEIRTIFDENTVEISAGNRRAFLFAAGRLLRELRYYVSYIEIPQLMISDFPYHSLRATLIPPHKQDNGYKFWDKETHRKYIEDLALWGANSIWSLPLQFGQNSEVIFSDPESEQAKKWEIMRDYGKLTEQIGISYGIFNNPSDVFIEDIEKNDLKRSENGDAGTMFIAPEQSNICPSTGKAPEIIIKRREELFSKLSNVSYLHIGASDPGGCACASCNPNTVTYLETASRMAEALKRHHPKAKVFVSTKLMTREGVLKYFIPYVNSAKGDFIDGILYALHGTALSLPELQGKINRKLEYVLFPDITMMDNWGLIGATPWIKHFNYCLDCSYDTAKECIKIDQWSNTGKDMFSEDYPTAFDPDTMSGGIDGTLTYSEGVHDDVAKIIWLAYNWDPHSTPEKTLHEYCRFYFGEKAAEYAEQALLLMEKISVRRCRLQFSPPLTLGDDGNGREDSKKLFDLVEKMKEKMPAWAKESWRYGMMEIRARIECAAFRVRDEKELTLAEAETLLDIAQDVNQKSGHISLENDFMEWDRKKARKGLNKLLTRNLSGTWSAPVPELDE